MMIALAALPALAAAGCFLLPPDGEPGVDAGVAGQPVYECTKVGDICDGGHCLDATGTLACYKGCTTIGDKCMDGVCYYVDVALGYFCMPEGAKKPGEYCKLPNECAPNVQCLIRETPVGQTSQCYPHCLNKYDCVDGDCTDTGLGFSVCLEPGA